LFPRKRKKKLAEVKWEDHDLPNRQGYKPVGRKKRYGIPGGKLLADSKGRGKIA